MASYLSPTALDEALAALAAEGPEPAERLTVLAGATDLYPTAAARQAWFQPTPRRFLDISGLGALRGIAPEEESWRIGALATWRDVIDASLPPAFQALKQAARQVGGAQIQNRGTVAGNLCNASPAADGAPPLLALDADVEAASLSADGGTSLRRIPLSAFLLGNRRTALRPQEIVTAIRVPAPAEDERSIFLKLGARAYLVISIASVAANVALDAAGRIVRARIAVGACSAVPQRLIDLEARLVGERPDAAARAVEARMLAALSPIDDIRASAAYRQEAALTLVRRALDALADRGRAAA